MDYITKLHLYHDSEYIPSKNVLIIDESIGHTLLVPEKANIVMRIVNEMLAEYDRLIPNENTL